MTLTNILLAIIIVLLLNLLEAIKTNRVEVNVYDNRTIAEDISEAIKEADENESWG